jgi:hypothetical protein
MGLLTSWRGENERGIQVLDFGEEILTATEQFLGVWVLCEVHFWDWRCAGDFLLHG